MSIRGMLKASAFAAVLTTGALAAPAFGAEPLRVCADPDNLPFSKAEGPERGLYVELAELVGARMNRAVEFVWWSTQYQRRALRNTILQDGCDAVFALPANAEYKVRGLQRSQPFLQVGYAIVAEPAYSFKSLDELKRRRLAVQFASTPQIVLSQYDGYSTTTYRSADDALTALAKGEVDAAFLWGPVAGYENKRRWDSRWRVTPVAGHDLNGAVAVAVQRGKDALVADIDRVLAELKPQIDQLADKYGFPRDPPVNLGLERNAARSLLEVPSSLVVAVQDSAARPAKAKPAARKTADKAPAAAAAPPAPASTLPEGALAGRVMFNDKCSHCHGSDGYSPVRERDIRYLKTRYGDKWMETATTTIKNGRSDAGMPVWKEILKDSDIQQILSFFGSIQK